MIEQYLKSLKGKTYKMLPIFEEDYAAFQVYVKSLSIELIGATVTFPHLETEKHFIDIINIVNYFSTHEVDHATCQKQVFKCLDLIDRIWTEG